MSSYRVHLGCSSLLGAGYGAVGIWYGDWDWGPVLLGAGLTALGGMLPDLDSDSGVPVRELFSLAAAAAPFLLFGRFQSAGFSPEQCLVLVAGAYLLIRFGVSRIFKRCTVHRGMFHSIPAMVIAGMAVFLLYDNPNVRIRVFVAVGVMIGFLSHLILDELHSVDFNGLKLRLNKYAGSALKFYSASWRATALCYLVLFALAFLCLVDVDWPVVRPLAGR